MFLSNGAGWRKRAIGNGEEVAQVGTAANGDAIGYAFWSVGNLAGQSPNIRYLQVDGVDPLNLSYVDGTLPTCTAPCPGIVSFANVASGNYPIWNTLRLVTHLPVPLGVKALITGAQNQVLTSLPDFLPLSAMGVLRSHYKQGNIFAVNGSGGPCNSSESGGDVGGAVITIQGDQDYCAATGVKSGRVSLRQ
jgi:hypothetical protein